MDKIIAALYKFAPLSELESLRKEMLRVCNKNSVSGTLLLAEEGINGTIAGTRQGVDAVLGFLRSLPPLQTLEHKESAAAEMPFYRMKIKIKEEIVTFGVPGIDPQKMAGTYLSPKDWNRVVSDPETIVIDTRNDYEVGIGTFQGALNPRTQSFREFPAFVAKSLNREKHKKVAMFCTGGIRCEKASAYMKKLGFEQVYHLKGGILKYLEEIPAEQSLWQGECFVFDQRVAVGHGLKPGSYTLCPSCRRPVGEDSSRNPKYIEGVACPACHDTLSPEKKAAAAERHRQIKLAAARGEKHIGYKYDEKEY
jgi:UPF0176 protein